ncbi:MAG TPA: FecR domain-containing protein [Polyangiaceae bacterium]|nr:FecR domain-containing protein [Polyangiaceae bacterium]
MADLGERVSEAREHVVPSWTPERERRVHERVVLRLELGRQRRVVALSFATLALIVGGLFAWQRGRPGVALHEPARQGAPVRIGETVVPELLHFGDGTSVTKITLDAQAEPVQVGEQDVTVRLAQGAARFSVTPNPLRTFRVLARDTTVTVLGTVFTVALDSDGVRVHVERGRVNVAWPSGERTLAVGEDAFVPGGTAAPAEPGEDLTVETEHAAHPAPAPSAPAGPSWRVLAQDGDYARAFGRMSAEGPSAVRDEPSDLLLAADVARLGGHPDKAIAPLQRVLSAHRGDSRAPLAAFTLGRTLLDQLGRPHEAADAFATARRLEPRGALAQDALAREVESWSRAGNAETARERAEAYVQAYPQGRRLKAVRRFGGLD